MGFGGVVAASPPSELNGPAMFEAVAERAGGRLPGNPGAVPMPAEAYPVDTSRPDRVIGSGTPASCTSQSVVNAVALGGGKVTLNGAGRLKVIDNVFTANRCDPTGPDVGGAALRVLSQYEGLPVVVATAPRCVRHNVACWSDLYARMCHVVSDTTWFRRG